MAQGILLLGLNGCGKTTVGRMISRRLALFRMDAEDYYFPMPGDYSVSRTDEEVRLLMEADVKKHGDFVLSCVRCNVSDELLRHIRLCAVLRASPELRAERIQRREVQRFGQRVLPGGDMYHSQQAFHAFAAGRTEMVVDETLGRLHCAVLELDASLPAETIADSIIQAYQA